MKVYVVAWEYYNGGKKDAQCGGGGFDWNFDEAKMKAQFEEEKKNADEFKTDDWEVVYFEVNTDWKNAEAITAQIDRTLATKFDMATTRYKAV